MAQKIYEMIVLGGGPAGATAAIYGARAGHSVLLLEKMMIGGEIVSTERLDNYPGFPEGLSGFEFGQRLEQQLRKFEIELVLEAVEQVKLSGKNKIVLAGGREYIGRSVIIATGTVPNLLNVPGEAEWKGRGVSYCATCDAAFYRGKDIAVVGGGDSALKGAIFLADFARKVFVIHRRNAFRGEKVNQDRLLALENVEVLWNSTVSGIEGDSYLTGLRILRDGKPENLEVQGVFVYTGRVPNTGFLEGEVDLTAGGYIIANESAETSLPGVYAAGDVRVKELRQVITAAADGAVAATSADRALRGMG